MGKKSLHSLFVLLLAVLFFLPYIQPAMADEPGTFIETDEGMYTPPPKQRLTLSERLLLQNAVCALWHNSMRQNSDPINNINPVTLTAPENIFINPLNGFYYDHQKDIWIFEGLVRKMGVQADGIEYISGINSFHMQIKRQADGSFRILFINFEPLGSD